MDVFHPKRINPSFLRYVLEIQKLLVGFMGMATLMTRRRGAGVKFQVGLKPLEFRSNELYTLLHTVLKG